MRLHDDLADSEGHLPYTLMQAAHALNVSARLGTIDDMQAAIASTISEVSAALQAHGRANRDGAAALRRILAARDGISE
jgi:hypothetical protein